ncbi:lactoperoxidase-like [Asterias amurensis]|uniref:lactoperoxidase-like n=1 Tax=Asterias amurensis TaxID=7602 RepID=UPI003AB8BD7A
MKSLIPWVVLLLLLVSIVSARHNEESDEAEDFADDIKILEDLEDLILRQGNIEAYIHHEGAGHGPNGRSPKNLLHQFSSIKTSPAAVRKLKKLWKKLERKNGPLAKLTPNYDMDKIQSSIMDVLGRAAVTSTKHCDDTVPYRSIDGTCNNIDNPEQGSAGTPLLRVVDNAYDDGISSPRTASFYYVDALPNARDVSNSVFDSRTKTNQWFTSLGIHFAQLIDHDLVAVEAQEIECGECDVQNECFAITIEDDDPVFGGAQTCFPFTRSDHDSSSPGVRQQLNSITTWLDASFVYGSDKKTAQSLIDDDKPSSLKHLTDEKTGRDLLPPNKDLEACAGVDEEAGIYCGLAGDGRVAEQPGLTSLHTLFLREHNRIAKELRDQNDELSNQEIYQQARKIVGAEWQHIIYNEFLPHITGAELYNSANLGPTAEHQYDPDVDASIANVFSSAAFRFGHTLVPDSISRAPKNYRTKQIKQIEMREAFFNATYMFDTSIPDGAVDSILRGMTVQRLDKVDRHLASAITENLFGEPLTKGDGFDLASLNIQRGRDHGIPSYTVIREKYCGFEPIQTYNDLKKVMRSRNVNALRRVYGRHGLEDIDAFVGFILEKPLPNALVGPTLACIFADQFKRLKFGDRFFYKNPDQFTSDEMDEIEKVTMARLMCDNIEGITEIQPYVFMPNKKFQKAVDSGDRYYNSFYEYSRSGFWPHEDSFILSGMNNRRARCDRPDLIPRMDLAKLFTMKHKRDLEDEP